MRFTLFLALSPLLCAQTTGAVEGVVVDSITRQPIAAVAVTLRHSTKPEFAYQAVTDEKGAFRITGMQEGEYGSRCDECRKPGYLSTPAGPQLPAPPLIVTHLAPVQVRFELIPLGKLRGRVLDGEGRPVHDTSIIMATVAGGSATGNAKTDAEGRFILEDV